LQTASTASDPWFGFRARFTVGSKAQGIRNILPRTQVFLVAGVWEWIALHKTGTLVLHTQQENQSTRRQQLAAKFRDPTLACLAQAQLSGGVLKERTFRVFF
jgi:hypothetical protein